MPAVLKLSAGQCLAPVTVHQTFRSHHLSNLLVSSRKISAPMSASLKKKHRINISHSAAIAGVGIGPSYAVSGLVISDHTIKVPLDYSGEF